MNRLDMLDHCEVISDTEVECVLENPNAVFLTALTDAVSYTHLDVYKRQTHGCAKKQCENNTWNHSAVSHGADDICGYKA